MSAFEGTACGGLAEISKYCQQYTTGIANTIEIIEAADVTSVPDPGAGTHTITTDITLDATKFWYQWRIGETDVEYSWTSVGVKGSQSFQNTLTVFLPVSRDLVENTINSMINGDFLIRFRDKQGVARLAGSAYSPVQVAEGGVQGVINAERNGTTVTFEWMGPTAYFYEGAAPLV